MIDWRALVPQVEALARYVAVREADEGRVRWTGALAREHNRRWLAMNVPDRLKDYPGAMEEGQCECGGVCLIGAADETGVYHVCKKCKMIYRVAWNQYRELRAGRAPASAGQPTDQRERQVA